MKKKTTAPPPRRRAPKTTKQNGLDAEVQEDIAAIGAMRLQIAELNEEVKTRQQRVVEALQAQGQKSMRVESGGEVWQATLVESESVTIDEDKLKKRLGTALWNKVSTRSLDRRKLDALLKAGDVKTTVVAQCSDITPRAPYTKIVKK